MASPAAIAANTSPWRTWIVSPAWDLFYIVLTPVLIVPAVLLTVRHWLAPEQIYLAVISFASLGHHLPGFMRAYGDRELFHRFQWRFLLAPPLAFGLALVFTPPPAIAAAFGLSWSHLHGLELALTLWGTWHGLMQTYGFMRIYDLRRGENDPRIARLDQALCVAMFTAGVVLSDARMHGLAAAMWEAGLPLFGARTLAILRIVVSVGCGAVVVAYVAHLANRRKEGLPLNGVKLVLAAITGWFFWYCGRLSTNLLVGLAMFEIYHAVQYDAIVWIYNKRLMSRAGERFGPLGFLFSDRLTMLGLYLAAIGAYSAMRFFTASPGDRMFSGDLYGVHQWIVAWFVASSLLHFYYDGFIWKVSEKTTRANLVDLDASAAAPVRLVPGAVHAAKWAAFAAAMAGLAWAEARGGAEAETARQLRVSGGLVALDPSRWEYHVDYGRNLERSDNAELALGEYRQAAGLAKAEAEPLDRLGTLLIRLGRPEEGAEALEKAVATGATSDEVYYELGLAYLQAGGPLRAIKPLRAAADADPAKPGNWLQLGDAYLAVNRPAAATAAYRRAVTLAPQAANARVALAEALLKEGAVERAMETLRDGLVLTPDSADLAFTMGLLLEQQGKASEAAPLFEKAAKGGLTRPTADSP